MKASQYQVVQFQVIKDSKGFCIAAFDEFNGGFIRLSKEEYPQFEEACAALFQGDWTPGADSVLSQTGEAPFARNFQPERWPAKPGGQPHLVDTESLSRLPVHA